MEDLDAPDMLGPSELSLLSLEGNGLKSIPLQRFWLPVGETAGNVLSRLQLVGTMEVPQETSSVLFQVW